VTESVFRGFGIEVRGLGREDFLKVRETLTRVGVMAGNNVLNQTCFILHKRGRYAIMHHSELKLMDGEGGNVTVDDIGHRNTVAHLLDQWGLVEVVEPEDISEPRAPMGAVAVIPHKAKTGYSLNPLYEIGRPR
jgi:hypothetical protein